MKVQTWTEYLQWLRLPFQRTTVRTLTLTLKWFIFFPQKCNCLSWLSMTFRVHSDFIFCSYSLGLLIQLQQNTLTDDTDLNRINLKWRVYIIQLIICLWRDSPQWARASSFMRFLDHTQRRTTVGRTPMDEWSARRRDLYLTTHDTHSRQTTMPPVGFEPTISADKRP